MKILFLDVDGVLNHYGSKTLLALSKPALRRLEHIVKQTGCSIVVSSTWRKLPETRRRLERALAYRGLKVLSYTTKEHWKIGQIRGDEIDDWLSKWTGVTRYAIVDDDSDFHEHHLPFFVQTDGKVGLTDADSGAIIKLLNEV